MLVEIKNSNHEKIKFIQESKNYIVEDDMVFTNKETYIYRSLPYKLIGTFQISNMNIYCSETNNQIFMKDEQYIKLNGNYYFEFITDNIYNIKSKLKIKKICDSMHEIENGNYRKKKILTYNFNAKWNCYQQVSITKEDLYNLQFVNIYELPNLVALNINSNIMNDNEMIKILNNITKHNVVILYINEENYQYLLCNKIIDTSDIIFCETGKLYNKLRSLKSECYKINLENIEKDEIEYSIMMLTDNQMCNEKTHGTLLYAKSFKELLSIIMNNLKEIIIKNAKLTIECDFKLSNEQETLLTMFDKYIEIKSVDKSINYKSTIINRHSFILCPLFPVYSNSINRIVEEYTCYEQERNIEPIILTISDDESAKIIVCNNKVLISTNIENIKLLLNLASYNTIIGINQNIINTIKYLNQIYIYISELTSKKNQEKIIKQKNQFQQLLCLDNINLEFANNSDYEIFDELINSNKLKYTYYVNGKHFKRESDKDEIFKVNSKLYFNTYNMKCEEIEVLQSGVYQVSYINETDKTIEMKYKNEIITAKNRNQMHIRAGTIVKNHSGFGLALLNQKINNEEITKYKLQMKFLRDKDGLDDLLKQYENYNNIHIYKSENADFFTTNLTIENYEYLKEKYHLLSDDIKFVIIKDANNDVQNIVTKVSILNQYNLSISANNEEIVNVINSHELDGSCEVIE